MITGESRPVPKDEGDEVIAGTVATDSAVRVRVDGGRRGDGARGNRATGR